METKHKTENVCNLCGCAHAETIFSKNGYNIVKCGECGLIYCSPMPSSGEVEELIEDFYETKKYSRVIGRYTDQDGSHFDNRPKSNLFYYKNFLKGLNKYFKQPGSLLEIGCGDGLFLKMAGEDGWQARGIEPSQKAYRHCKAAGLDVFCGSYKDYPHEENSFDAVVSNAVIEHLPEPASMIKLAYKALKKDGVFLLITPNINSQEAKREGINWAQLIPPAHLYYFTPGTLRKIVELNGFKVSSIDTISIYDNIEIEALKPLEKIKQKKWIRKILDSKFIRALQKLRYKFYLLVDSTFLSKYKAKINKLKSGITGAEGSVIILFCKKTA